MQNRKRRYISPVIFVIGCRVTNSIARAKMTKSQTLISNDYSFSSPSFKMVISSEFLHLMKLLSHDPGESLTTLLLLTLTVKFFHDSVKSYSWFPRRGDISCKNAMTDVLHTIKTVLKDIITEGVEQIHVHQDRDNLWAVMYINNGFSYSIRGGIS